MIALIFNSGMGSRMEELTQKKPKCMVELYNGETIFERQIRILSSCGINKFIVTTGPYKNKLIEISKKYNNLDFTFVENQNYKTTNYIVSMNNCYNLLNEETILLHGDLVFNKGLIRKILSNKNKSVCLYNEEKELPKKDFKAKFCNNVLKQVSISIFDKDCYAFQPLYKLSKEDIGAWKDKVNEFVENGQVSVYAENALNEITDNISIIGMSYKDDYIDEIDNKEDYIRVSNEIKYFDYREQEIEVTNSYKEVLKKNINNKEEIFIVCSKVFTEEIKKELEGYKITIFNDYSANPKYEEIKKGIEIFKKRNYETIIAMGGGSAMDVAKCIKLFSTLENELDFIEKKYKFSNTKLICIPTTAGTGSESTGVAVMYYEGKKLSIEHNSILPNLAILDGNLLKTLPDYQKKSTLLDSLCQAIESYWSIGTTEESRDYSKKCISIILKKYKDYIENKSSSYKKILQAANYSGKAINISRTTSAHAMSYKITSIYGISHGHAVALCIIPVWKFLTKISNENVELKKTLLEIAKLFNKERIEDSITYFENIVKEFNLPKIEIKDDDLPILINSVNIERMKNNPIEFNKKDIEKLYIKIKDNK